LMTWNLSEELPQLITKIFIFYSPFPIKLCPGFCRMFLYYYYTPDL